MALIYAILFVCAALIWGDWRHFKKYYPTMLFVCTVNLVVLVLTYNYSLWRFHYAFPGSPNHVPAAFLIMFVNFSALILIFLGRYPQKIGKQVLWTLLFVAINSICEWIGIHKHSIIYEHGWSYGWSIMINALMYPTLRLHHTRPLYAVVFTLLVFAFFIWYFQIPLSKVK
jgi:hypothetical protein